MEALLDRLYTDPSSPAAYSGVENLLREAQRHDPNVKRKDVEEYLYGQTTYTLFKPRRVRYRRLKTIPAGYMTDMQADLADFQQLAAQNNGYRYLLVAVDVLSRRIFTAPVRSKKAEHMREAFDEIFAQTPHLPWSLYTDKGNEFESSQMRAYFKGKDIEKIVSQSDDVKASLAERSIQTLKSRLYRYFSNRNLLSWIDVVPRIVEAINRSPSRAIAGWRPMDVCETNWKKLWTSLYAADFINKHRRSGDPRYEVGSKVRIDKRKGRFDRGFHPNYTDEIFTVSKVIKGQPDSYRIEDRDKEPIIGRFYRNNFSKTKDYQEVAQRIAKVHRERRRNGQKQYLVSWVGHDANTRTWINEDQIIS